MRQIYVSSKQSWNTSQLKRLAGLHVLGVSPNATHGQTRHSVKLSCGSIELKTKFMLTKSIVLLTTVYTCEMWPAVEINISDNRDYFNIDIWDRLYWSCSEWRAGGQCLQHIIAGNSLRLLGLTLPMPDNRHLKRALEWTSWSDKRNRGRPRG